jgi:hypothetical protein
MRIDDETVSQPFETSVTSPPEEIIKAMREYFRLIEEFLTAITGKRPAKFAPEGNFIDQMKRNIGKILPRAEGAFATYVPKLLNFHSQNTALLLGAAKSVGGMRSVIGGGSGFPQTAFDGFRKFALYADTIFIPDPVLPWLEIERRLERFQHMRLIEACYDLLRLKPLVDAELPYPAVIVFPSWEKRLAQTDSQTQDGISSLMLGFFSRYLDASFEDESDVLSYIQGSGRDAFRLAVDRFGLFIPPGSDQSVPFEEAVRLYKEHIAIWRTEDVVQTLENQTPEVLAWLGIMERLEPQFHIRDNAKTLEAQPLFWLPVHSHYFQLCSDAGNSTLNDAGIITPQTFAALQTLNQPNLAWLGNVGIEDIVRMRQDNQNEVFRGKIAGYLAQLSQAELQNIDRVTTEVVRGISTLLIEHDREVKKLTEDYRKKLTQNVVGSVITTGVTFLPWLTPFIGAGVLTLAPLGKAMQDSFVQFRGRRLLSKTLTGILVDAKRK